MQLNQTRILLTGASGGLGEALAQQLSAAGAALLLTGRNADRLAEISLAPGCEYFLLPADLNSGVGIETVALAARDFGANVLINNAGVGGFGLLESQDWATVEQILATNLQAPIRLTHALLPWLNQQPGAAIINIGSTFGSIPFAGFAAYSAAKAGLRGFSQALRRELADSSVRVIHVSPRAIDTTLNTSAVNQLNSALKNASDSPATVAARIVRRLQDHAPDSHLGFPEKLFAWLNGVAPGLIDRGLSGKLATIKHHANKP
ncbi:MAG TPA: SDR family oxidoreductase [Rhodocyclaceae bacterium]|nr:SDR family oxidoreductase [Rhodocyclaceae bacterium]